MSAGTSHRLTPAHSTPDAIGAEFTRVAAVVVLYHPDLNLLQRLLRSLGRQAHSIFLVDNTPGGTPDLETTLGVVEAPFSYIPLGDNKGIATAHNVGIRKSIESGHTHVLLLDQDSCLAAEMVHQLLTAEESLLRAGTRVAAVGPLFLDEKTEKYSFAIRGGKLGVRRIQLQPNCAPTVETDHLIASGSLIRVAALTEIGMMRDDLFIDWVDIEWGIRARRKGYFSYIVPTIVMRHSIGDATVRVLGREIYLHSDIRNYYMVRNATFLLRSGYMKSWRTTAFLNIVKYVVFYSLYSKNQWKSSKLLLSAVGHGLQGRLGRLN